MIDDVLHDNEVVDGDLMDSSALVTGAVGWVSVLSTDGDLRLNQDFHFDDEDCLSSESFRFLGVSPRVGEEGTIDTMVF